jgi:putative sensory transduction regulator
MNAPNIISTITPEAAAAVLHEAGFRADVVKDEKTPRVRSAVQGLAFSIVFMSQPDAEGRYCDFTFHCPLRVRGELPAGIIDEWNQAKRFARLTRNEHFLYVSMDVMLAGGVTTEHLRAHCELWDQLIRELFTHLRRSLDTAPAVAATAAA